MATRKTSRGNTPAQPAKPAAKARVVTKPVAGKKPVAATPKPAAPVPSTPGKSAAPAAPEPRTRTAYLQAGLKALAQRIRLEDQAGAKKIEPTLAHLAQAYQRVLGKA